MTDPSALTSFTPIAVRAIGGELWIELDDGPMTLKEADRLHKQGVLVKAIRRVGEMEQVVVKAARDVPKKVLDWRRKGDA
jgi:hypothetical protein